MKNTLASLAEGHGVEIKTGAEVDEARGTALFREWVQLGMVLKAGIWEFPKIRGTLFWGPYSKDPTIRVLC